MKSQDADLEELEERIQRLRSFGSLRRALRTADEVEAIAAAARSFALGPLRCKHFSIYCADRDEADFDLLSPPDDGAPSEPIDLPNKIDRTGALAEQLQSTAALRGRELSDLLGLHSDLDVVMLGLRGQPEQLIGILVVAGGPVDMELLNELVFDVESVLAARMIGRLRAEELAVLEIQERELVGLLRDVEARDAIIQRDLEEARQFQRKMLGAPPRVEQAAIEVVYQPLGLVGGDLYAVSVEAGTLRVFIADATGHGVRASLTTMFIKSGYEAVRRAAPDPASLLSALNDAIAHTYRSSEMLFSGACVDLDLASGRVLIAAAAHPAICVVRGGEAELIEGGGAFLGLRSNMKFSNTETAVAKGDGIYVYTDGFMEARKQQEQFGEERLKGAIVGAHRAGTPVGSGIVSLVTAFLDGAPLDDDGTFVGVRFGAEQADAPLSTR